MKTHTASLKGADFDRWFAIVFALKGQHIIARGKALGMKSGTKRPSAGKHGTR